MPRNQTSLGTLRTWVSSQEGVTNRIAKAQSALRNGADLSSVLNTIDIALDESISFGRDIKDELSRCSGKPVE